MHHVVTSSGSSSLADTCGGSDGMEEGGGNGIDGDHGGGGGNENGGGSGAGDSGEGGGGGRSGGEIQSQEASSTEQGEIKGRGLHVSYVLYFILRYDRSCT